MKTPAPSKDEASAPGTGTPIVIPCAFPSKRGPVGRGSMKSGPHNLPAAGASGEQLSFIEPPPFCPAWPKRNTLADRALKLFLDGRVFDHPDFLEGCGSWRLAAVVFQLRTLGWPVETVEIPSPSEEHPGRKIALYKLSAKVVALALATMTGALQ